MIFSDRAILSALQRVEGEIRKLRNEVKAMGAREDAFTTAMNDLTTAVTKHAADVDKQIAAAIAAHDAEDDAAFAAATDRVKALTASLTDAVGTATAATDAAPAA